MGTGNRMNFPDRTSSNKAMNADWVTFAVLVIPAGYCRRCVSTKKRRPRERNQKNQEEALGHDALRRRRTLVIAFQ